MLLCHASIFALKVAFNTTWRLWPQVMCIVMDVLPQYYHFISYHGILCFAVRQQWSILLKTATRSKGYSFVPLCIILSTQTHHIVNHNHVHDVPNMNSAAKPLINWIWNQINFYFPTPKVLSWKMEKLDKTHCSVHCSQSRPMQTACIKNSWSRATIKGTSPRLLSWFTSHSLRRWMRGNAAEFICLEARRSSEPCVHWIKMQIKLI